MTIFFKVWRWKFTIWLDPEDLEAVVRKVVQETLSLAEEDKKDQIGFFTGPGPKLAGSEEEHCRG